MASGTEYAEGRGKMPRFPAPSESSCLDIQLDKDGEALNSVVYLIQERTLEQCVSAHILQEVSKPSTHLAW